MTRLLTFTCVIIMFFTAVANAQWIVEDPRCAGFPAFLLNATQKITALEELSRKIREAEESAFNASVNARRYDTEAQAWLKEINDRIRRMAEIAKLCQGTNRDMAKTQLEYELGEILRLIRQIDGNLNLVNAELLIARSAKIHSSNWRGLHAAESLVLATEIARWKEIAPNCNKPDEKLAELAKLKIPDVPSPLPLDSFIRSIENHADSLAKCAADAHSLEVVARDYLKWCEIDLEVRKGASAALIDSGDTIIFTITVRNTGKHELEDLDVIDKICPNALLQGGDTDGDSLLDPGEIWTYQCTKRVNTKDLRQSEILRNQVEVVARGPSKAKVKTTLKKSASTEVKIRALTEVPDLVGTTLEIARETITGASLRVGKVEYVFDDTDVTKGDVVRQSPEAGRFVRAGTFVDIVVSKGLLEKAESLFVDPPRVTIKVGEKTTAFRAILVYNNKREEDVTRWVVWDPGGSDPTFTCAKAGKFIKWASFGGSMRNSATITCEEDWSVPAFQPPISRSSDRNAKVPQAGPGDYTWYAFCEPRTGEVTYGQHLMTGRSIMSGPFPGPRTVYDWIAKNCPNWRCDTSSACAKTPAMGGRWKVLCGKNDLRVVLGETHDFIKYMLIKEGFLGEPDARAWVNQVYPDWVCLADGRSPGPSTGLNKPRKGGNWAVVCSRHHGGVGLTQHPDPISQWIWNENVLSEPDARLWADQNCPSWRCDSQGKCLTGVARGTSGDQPLELPPEPGSGSWSEFAEGFRRGAREGLDKPSPREEARTVQKPVYQPVKPSDTVRTSSSSTKPSDSGVNSEALRAGYIKKCLEMRESYAKQNCAQNRNYSGCFLDPVGCYGYVVSDALPDGRSQGRVGCGRGVVEQYISCLTACNQGLLQKRYNMNTVPTCGNECKTKALDAIKGCNTGSR